MTTGKVLRGVVGLVVLVALIVTVSGWWGEYQKASPSRLTSEASATASATETVNGKPSEPSPADVMASSPHVLILIDGLNFREKPDATGSNIRGLKKGDSFILVGESGTWLKVQDTAGKVGWINNNPQYVKIEKK